MMFAVSPPRVGGERLETGRHLDRWHIPTPYKPSGAMQPRDCALGQHPHQETVALLRGQGAQKSLRLAVLLTPHSGTNIHMSEHNKASTMPREVPKNL